MASPVSSAPWRNPKSCEKFVRETSSKKSRLKEFYAVACAGDCWKSFHVVLCQDSGNTVQRKMFVDYRSSKMAWRIGDHDYRIIDLQDLFSLEKRF